MWWLIAEAVAALAIGIFIVWWTMFSGRRKDPAPRDDDVDTEDVGPDRPR